MVCQWHRRRIALSHCISKQRLTHESDCAQERAKARNILHLQLMLLSESAACQATSAFGLATAAGVWPPAAPHHVPSACYLQSWPFGEGLS